MKIQITWNKPDGTRPSVELAVKANDPHRDDEQLQVHKAIGAAQAHFNQKFSEAPSSNQLSVNVIKE